MQIVNSNTKSKFKNLFLLILSLIFLSGCWDVKEVNDLAIVIATGIDQIEDNKIEVTFLLYVPTPSGGTSGEGSSSSKNSFSISTKGDTFSDAITELEIKVPREIYWGHSNIFIFGSELAKNGLAEQTDFIVRIVEPREQAQIYISENPAKELLDKFIKMNIAELFDKLPKDTYLKSITLKDMEQMLVNQSQAGVIPVSSTIEIDTASEKVESFAVNGSAIIHHGKLVNIITGEKDLGSHWIVFPNSNIPISITPAETLGKVTTVSIRKSFKLNPKIENGNWKMEIKVKGNFEILQNTTNLDMFKQSVIDQLEIELNKKIQKEIEIFLDYMQKDLNADVFQFYEAFHRSFPKESKKEKDNWDQKFENIEVTVKVDTNIDNPGVTNLHTEKR
jgi:spore germination protein KC